MNKSSIVISHPAAQELEETLRFTFQHLSPNELGLRINMMMQQFQSGQLDLGGVFQAKQDNILVGALYAQSRPDGSVMLWTPAMAEGVSMQPILDALIQFCRSQKAFAAVAISDRNQSFDEQTFCTVGQFQFLSDLIYLVVDIQSQHEHESPTQLTFIPLADYSNETSERLIRLVKSTYHNALDFPALMQIAPVEAVLRGYQAGALFRPELWFFVQHKGNDVGALLLTDAAPDQFELTYMGLIEPARRKGFGKEIVRFAKSVTSQWKRELLLTSVDGNNTPACQSYLSQGFKAWDRKKVYVRLF